MLSKKNTHALPAPLTADEVLAALTTLQRPVRLDDLLRVLDLSRRDKKSLLVLLEQQADQGHIMRLPGGKWMHAGQARLIVGTLAVQKSGVAFVTPYQPDMSTLKDTDADDVQARSAADKQEDAANAAADSRYSSPIRSTRTSRQAPPVATGHAARREQRAPRPLPDIFIRPADQGEAWHGDVVEVMLLPGRTDRTGRAAHEKRSEAAPSRNPEGRVVRIVERRQLELSVLMTRRRTALGFLCRPTDSRLNVLFDVDVRPLPAEPQEGALLRVKPGQRKEDGLWTATAVATLGREDDARVQERLVKINHQIPMEFPDGVLAEASQLAHTQDNAPLAISDARQDLRHFDFVTIDGADARDFDDAICVAQQGKDWILHVAIADVSWFVRPGSGLDREARARGNSCYFPQSVEPMLPEALSNGLCSLLPDEDRLTLVARMQVTPSGQVTESTFMPAVIRSRARLTYEAVQLALDPQGLPPEVAAKMAQQAPQPVPASVLPMLKQAAELARVLRTARMDRGALNMDMPEPAYDLDAEGRVLGIRRAHGFFANHLIEECMLCANEAVARFLTSKDMPFPCRVHPEPDPDRLSALFRTLTTINLPISLPARPTAQNLKQVLDTARDTPQEFVVTRLVLRTMMQARYAAEAAPHFGLASACYCHFTSPIRRYADLMVHRALRLVLGHGVGVVPARQKLMAVADQCNGRERAAQDAEREMTRRLACMVLAGREGEVFSGIISGIMESGFFVEFVSMPVEGMVRLTSLTDDWYAYDPDRQELLGAGTGRAFRLGQTVSVRMDRADLGRLEIDLTLVGQDAPVLDGGGRRPLRRTGNTPPPRGPKASRDTRRPDRAQGHGAQAHSGRPKNSGRTGRSGGGR